MYQERIIVIISQGRSLRQKQETLPKGVRVAKFDFINTLRNQLFSRVRVVYYQYSISNDSGSILKSKIMSILMIVFVVVYSI